MPTSRSLSLCNGFTLIEVMVAIVLIAIGLLGLAGLQVNMLFSGASSGHRTIATQQAANLADGIRANRTAFDDGAFNVTAPTSPVTTQDCLRAAGCTPAQMANTLLKIWNDDNARLLPGGTGTVCQDSTPNDGTPTSFQCDGVTGAPYAIKIWWNDDRKGNFQRFVTAFNP